MMLLSDGSHSHRWTHLAYLKLLLAVVVVVVMLAAKDQQALCFGADGMQTVA